MLGFLKKHWRKIVVVAVSLPLVGYLILCGAIGLGVRGAVADAQSQFPLEPVAALMSMATSEDAPIAQRNRAIWALGQLGNRSALPVLQGLVTGEPCDHDKLICQHEVESAIKGCSGGFNAGAIVWRHGYLADASVEGSLVRVTLTSGQELVGEVRSIYQDSLVLGTGESSNDFDTNDVVVLNRDIETIELDGGTRLGGFTGVLIGVVLTGMFMTFRVASDSGD